MMTEVFGASDAEGGWSMREAYDALEVAQVLLLGDPASPLNNLLDAPSCLARLERLGAMLPTQTYRSEKQIALQQFSTPLPLAWLVAKAAAVTRDDLVLEPSAGTGMLAIHARRAGASLLANERDPGRATLLAAALDIPVSRHDAEFIDDLLAAECQPSVLLINPPFSRN